MVSKDAIKQFVNKNIILKNIFDFFLYFYRIYKYLIFEYPKNKRFQKNGEKVLLEVCEILSSNNINYWLDAGTLLGIIRDNKLLKNDLDLDFGLWLSEYNENLPIIMEKFGFKYISKVVIDEGKYGMEETYTKYGVSIDFFYFSKINNNNIYNHLFIENSKLKYNFNGERIYQPIEQYYEFNGLMTIDYKKRKISVPRLPNLYLKSHYGADYLVPRKWLYYDFINDNKNIKFLNDKIGIQKIAKK